MDSESGAVGRQVARLLVGTGAIHFSRRQPFILAAGWASPVYVDCRLLIGESITELTAQFVAATVPDPFDAVAGAETAGIPFAAWLADETGSLLRYVRKRPLGIGGRGPTARIKKPIDRNHGIYRERDSQGVEKSHIFAFTRPPQVMEALR
jgi:orotate phosphoribosyltransferase